MNRTFIVLAALLATSLTALGQEWAKARLEKSPRHQEWVKLKQGARELECFVVYPEVGHKALAVVLIHEIFGLSDWVRSVADQLAEAGYIAVAPDFLSGMAAKGGGTSELGSRDLITRTVSGLPPDQVTADLRTASDYASHLPASNGKVAVAGFCWGGTQSFRFATNNTELKAAFVFYGTGPEAGLARIACPVFGFYGGEDARVTSTVARSADLMKKEGKTYQPVTYEGAGHGFMRAGEEPEAKPANKKARDQAWQRWLALLKTTDTKGSAP
jgi:carboxymethylenebutenolidase